MNKNKGLRRGAAVGLWLLGVCALPCFAQDSQPEQASASPAVGASRPPTATFLLGASAAYAF